MLDDQVQGLMWAFSAIFTSLMLICYIEIDLISTSRNFGTLLQIKAFKIRIIHLYAISRPFRLRFIKLIIVLLQILISIISPEPIIYANSSKIPIIPRVLEEDIQRCHGKVVSEDSSCATLPSWKRVHEYPPCILVKLHSLFS